ncbi:MAG TPA: NAD(P)-binding domain-containing protein [Actinomycetota bacterium]
MIGAGSSGLAVLRALRGRGVTVRCFERGSQAGGLWRYQNDNGVSSAYASLRTNVSRPRMEYPSFPMPTVYGDFPHHSDMAAYLEAYGESFGHRRFIRFRSTVERLEPVPDGTWRVLLDDGSVHRFRAAVVATGLHWCPKRPEHPGRFFGAVSHSHDYRVPEPFARSRVLVVGGGQSAAEIAVEVSLVATRTYLSVRRGYHVLPRRIGGSPYDASDIPPFNRMPWWLMNLLYARDVAREVGPIPREWPTPPRRLLEGIPIISTDLLPAIRRGDVLLKPAVERLAGDRVRFADGSEEPFDRIIYATGYRISLPFVCPSLVAPRGREFPLYRRIVPLGLRGLLFAGFVDVPGGLLPVVEDQAEWIAALLTGHLRIPPTKQMRRAIDRAERRTRERFPEESAHSVRCDPHAYRRLLRSDLRRARRRALQREGPPLFDDLVRTLELSRKRMP